MVFISRKVVVSPGLNLLNNILKRHGSRRPNTVKPKTPHFERQKYLILSRVLLPPNPEEFLPQSMKCRLKLEKAPKVKEDKPFAVLIGRKIFKMWDEAKMILVFHHNSIKGDEHYNYRVQFYRQQMEYRKYWLSMVRHALKDSRFENVLPIYGYNSSFVCSPEVKLAESLKLLTKMPGLVLLTAIIDNRMLSRAEIERYASIGNITNARSQFVSTLNSAGQSLVTNTTSLQQNLVSLLDLHAKQLSDSSPCPPSPAESSNLIDGAIAGAVQDHSDSKPSEASVQASDSTDSKPSEASVQASDSTEKSLEGESEKSEDSSSSSSDSDSDSDSEKK
nr:PREDICTED: 39S ribosomal protein L10, mitochondrial-like isoform X2 [Bemisia tabaci]